MVIFGGCLSSSINQCLQTHLLQSCLTLCNFMDYSLPGSSVHGILQARILEWVVMPSFRESSRPRDWIHVSCVSCTEDKFFTTEPSGKSSINLHAWFLSQCHIFLITIVLQCSLKLGSMISLDLYFCTRLLWLFGVYVLQADFRTICSNSMEEAVNVLIYMVFNLWNALSRFYHLKSISLPIYEHGISLFFVIFNFFHLFLIVIRIQIFHFLD